MTYEEPMPWFGDACPYGVKGCTCFRRAATGDAYEHWLLHLAQMPVDRAVAVVDEMAPTLPWWRRIIHWLFWRFG